MSTKPSVSSQNNDRRSINPATDSYTNLNTSGNINGSTYNSQKNSLNESRRPVNLDEDESQLNNYLGNQNSQKMSNNETNKRSINNNAEMNTGRASYEKSNNNQNFNSNSNNTFNNSNVRQNNVTPPKSQRTAINTNQSTPTRPNRQAQQPQKQQKERVVNQSPRRNEAAHIQHHGAGTRIVKRELWWKEPDRESKVPFNQPFRLKDVTPRIDDKNPNYNPDRQSTKIIDSRKLEWNAKSAVDTWANINHQPGGGNVRYPNMRVEWDVVSSYLSLVFF
jgi:hypothetical protein